MPNFTFSYQGLRYNLSISKPAKWEISRQFCFPFKDTREPCKGSRLKKVTRQNVKFNAGSEFPKYFYNKTKGPKLKTQKEPNAVLV